MHISLLLQVSPYDAAKKNKKTKKTMAHQIVRFGLYEKIW